MSDASPSRPRASILVVDDDAALADQLRWALAADHDVRVVNDAPAALAALKRAPPDLLLLDLCLPPRNTPEEGFDILRAARRSSSDPIIVVMSALEEREAAVRAVGEGAYDFFSKPFDLPSLRLVVRRALDRRTLERENQLLRAQLREFTPVEGLTGSSAALARLTDFIRRVADSSVTVYLEGESGAGKEVVARAIHRAGPRRDAPFVAVHCAALPETLLESELFGHEKGAFTGADEVRIGRFEAAAGGTLFLDEVGCLSSQTQVKLLRVLEERVVERLGAAGPRAVDFRLIVATNEDLEKKVQSGGFRDDLFFRIHVCPFRLPALRERREDIPALTNQFLRAAAERRGGAPRRLSAAAQAVLAARPWPGNVRELKNLLESVDLLVDKPVIDVADLPGVAGPGVHRLLLDRARAVGLKQAIEESEREALTEAIRQAAGAKAQAARELGLNPSQMKYLVQKHGL
jgi:DNA-binding NtrC family response regulator